MTAGLAVPGAASAATAAKARPGATVTTTGQAGYMTGGGRHFRFVQATVQVSKTRTVFQSAGVALGGRGVTHAVLLADAGGGAGSVWWDFGYPPPGDRGFPLARLSPSVGDMLRLSVFFDQRGHVYFTAVDTTKGVSQTVTRQVPATNLYLEARALVYTMGYTAPVATDFRLWSFTNIHVTTYSGIKGTMRGPWATIKLAVSPFGGPGPVVMGPSVLFGNGAAFNVLRR